MPETAVKCIAGVGDETVLQCQVLDLSVPIKKILNYILPYVVKTEKNEFF